MKAYTDLNETNLWKIMPFKVTNYLETRGGSTNSLK